MNMNISNEAISNDKSPSTNHVNESTGGISSSADVNNSDTNNTLHLTQQSMQRQIPPMAALSASSHSIKSPSNEFVRKLFSILESNAYPQIVRWTEDGKSFVVLDTGKFTTQILPNHFKHSNFASFVRQLNKYDFHKVKRKPDEKPKSKTGELSWEFNHPSFSIHNTAGLDNIKRKVTATKKINNNEIENKYHNHNIDVPNTAPYISSTVTNKIKDDIMNNFVNKDTFQTLKRRVASLENQLAHSKNETTEMKQEIKKMNTKYDTLLDSLITFKTVHENLVNYLNTLCSSLNNHGIDIPQNIYSSSNTINLPLQYRDNANNNPNNIHNNINNNTGRSSTSPENSSLQASNIGDNRIPPILDTADNGMLLPMHPSELQSDIRLQNSKGENSTVENNNNTNAGIMRNNDDIADNITFDNIKVEEQRQVGSFQSSPDDDSGVSLRKGFHVLLVEDDAISIQLCSKFLRKYGCTVEVVTDGLSAISTLEKFRYDLVLMDIVMPNLDGATATSIVRSFDNQTPIIAMTGNIEDQDLLTYLQHGMNDILAKPFTRNDLHSMLVRYLKDRIPLCEQKTSITDSDQMSPTHQLTPARMPTVITPSQEQSQPQPQAPAQAHPQQFIPAINNQRHFETATDVQTDLNSTSINDEEHIIKKQRI